MSWWRGEGNADDSAGPNNGVAQNGVTYVPGVIGQAFNFNGTTSDVLIPTSTTLNLADGFTIALWINLPTGVAQSLRRRQGDRNQLDRNGLFLFI